MPDVITACRGGNMPNSQWIRGIVICLVLLITAAVVQMPAASTRAEQEEQLADYDSLKTLFDEARSAGDHEKAIEIGKELHWVTETKHTEALYDIACIYALEGNRAKAYEYLYRAIDAGFWDIQRMRKDEDLGILHEDDLFRNLSRRAWANGYLYMLERDEREEFQHKEMVLEKLELEPGEIVADIGAGSGYFTIPVAKAVGPEGKVLAIDIMQPMLDYIERRLVAEKLENVDLVKVERDDPQLPMAAVDLILMVDTIHYVKERTAYGKKLVDGLAPGGRLVIIDYIPKPWEERPWGPHPDQQIPKETLNEEMDKAGLKVIEEYDFLPEQYFIVYEAK
jgi:protein-L-isoaspartate O-methyltransferase